MKATITKEERDARLKKLHPLLKQAKTLEKEAYALLVEYNLLKYIDFETTSLTTVIKGAGLLVIAQSGWYGDKPITEAEFMAKTFGRKRNAKRLD